MEQVTTRRILRVFGVSGKEVALAMRKATQQGCPSPKLLSKDGEFALCFMGRGSTMAQAQKEVSLWEQWFREVFGPAVYGTEGQTLAQVTVEALLSNRRLAVAADEFTGNLLVKAFQPISHSEAVFDFGNQSYRNEIIAPRMKSLPALEADPLQEAAGRADTTRQLTGADYAVTFSPRKNSTGAFVLISTVRACFACPVPNDMNEGGIMNCLCEVLRRMALGLNPLSGTIMLRPGRPGPKLGFCAIDPAIPMVEDLKQAEEDAKISILPETPVTQEINLQREGFARERSFSPEVQDFVTQMMNRAERRTPDLPTEPLPEPLLTREEPISLTHTGPLPEPLPDPLSRQNDRPGGLWEELGGRAAPSPEEEPAPNSLDRIADTIELELTQGELSIPRPLPDPLSETQTIRQHSLNELQQRLYGMELEEQPGPLTTSNREKDMEHARKRGKQFLLCALVVALAALIVILAVTFRGGHGKQPNPRSYGTATFDQTAQEYLNNAREKDSTVTAYLAWPTLAGTLLYSEPADTGLVANAAEDQPTLLVNAAGLTRNLTNSIIPCGSAMNGLERLTTLEGARENAGFTLYTQDTITRYKVVGVYCLDKNDAFLPHSFTDLTNYKDYLDFVLGVKMRSLFSYPINVGEKDSFATLMLDQGDTLLAVTGRRIRTNEDTNLPSYEIIPNQEALLPSSMGGSEDAQAAAAHWLDWYQTGTKEQAQESDSSGDSSLNQLVNSMEQATLAILSSTDALMANLTDLKADGTSSTESEIKTSGEGEMPTTELSVDQLLSSLPSAQPMTPPSSQPTQEPQEEPDDPEDGGDEEPEPSDIPEPPQGGSDSAGETISVNMNGSNVTMDLVECLAMVARNELGANAPDEAYKAQMVATHCWILSQGGYPSVLGMTPSDHLRSLAREVAHVLVTYNGQVCFTPYFASASTGTASSASVWGGERAYLQPVESPYDREYATNWNTNGSSSSTALFSREAVQARIESVLGLDMSGIDPEDWITVLNENTNQYGWIGRGGIQIGQGDQSTTCSGTWFRETLLCRQSVSGGSLRSSCFTVSYQETEDGSGYFVFDVYGYGHGCGMSQWGAVGYAHNGWNYAQILQHYFTGTTLVTY